MTCAEFQELAPLWAAGALSAEDHAACEAHFAQPGHDGCAEALARANDAAALLVEALPAARPPKHVWTAIEAALGPEASATPRARPGVWRERFAWGAAAAAVLAVGLQARSNRKLADEIGRVREQRAVAEQTHADDARALTDVRAARDGCARDLERVNGRLSAREEALSLLAAPSTSVVQLAAPQGDARATALVNVGQRRAVIVASALAPRSDGDYELWLIRGDRKIAAGLLKPEASGAALATLEPELLAEGPPDAVAVTLEALGGGVQPKGPIVLVGTMPKT